MAYVQYANATAFHIHKLKSTSLQLDMYLCPALVSFLLNFSYLLSLSLYSSFRFGVLFVSFFSSCVTHTCHSVVVCCLTCIDYINGKPCKGRGMCGWQLWNDISLEAFANDENHHDFSINQMCRQILTVFFQSSYRWRDKERWQNIWQLREWYSIHMMQKLM